MSHPQISTISHVAFLALALRVYLSHQIQVCKHYSCSDTGTAVLQEP
uniref:Galactokinase n=1 Tax=Rhizophora mucronata TaxID=61149 RepID=A0A2P2MS51_RHIMU